MGLSLVAHHNFSVGGNVGPVPSFSVDAVTYTGSLATPTGSLSWSGTDDLLLAVYADISGSTTPTISGTNYTWNKVISGGGVAVYWAAATSPGSETVNVAGYLTGYLNIFALLGANTSSPIDTSTSGTSPLTITTTAPYRFVFASMYSNQFTQTPDAGWSLLGSPAGYSQATEYIVAASAGPLTATLSSGAQSACLVAIKGA